MGKRSILFNQLKYNNIIFKNEINKCKLTPSLSSSGEQILIALSIISKISVLFSSVTWVNLLPLKLYFLNINYNYFLNQFEFGKDILNLNPLFPASNNCQPAIQRCFKKEYLVFPVPFWDNNCRQVAFKNGTGPHGQAGAGR